MIYSMTGYAARTLDVERGALHIELKSVNSRYLDFQFRVGEELRVVEPALRELFSARITRGKLECRLSFAAATARVQRLDRDSELLRLTIQGNPVICSQSPLLLSGFRAEIDHPWIVVRAMHTLDQSGYITDIEAQKTLNQAASYHQPKGLMVRRPK